MEDCLFCKIYNGQSSAQVVYKDDEFIVFKDIKPDAPVHLLIVPKKHIVSINHLKLEDKELMGELLLLAKKIAEKEGIAEKGYKLVFNVGKGGGGQLIDHLHLHLLAGWPEKNKTGRLK